jgi:hypothetical protein
MRQSFATFFLVAHLIVVCWARRHESQHHLFQVDPLSARILMSNNFESGSADPWYDSSPSSVNWNAEDLSSPAEINYPPPNPTSGTKYLRAIRNAQLSAGLLILRTVTFTALPGDKMTFNFWIRSRYASGNVLEVKSILVRLFLFIQLTWYSFLQLVMAVGDVETTILTLTSYSTAVNFDWRQASASLPVSEPTDVTVRHFSLLPG